MKIFLASPLGFAESTKLFLPIIKQKLTEYGYVVVDPWASSSDLEDELMQALQLPNPLEKEKQLHDISMKIAGRNASLIRSCNGLLAVLDGSDVDSGTASEIGYTFGIGNKVINGYRGDFRSTGENAGLHVNLQVQYWIEQSGGKIITSIDQIHSLSF